MPRTRCCSSRSMTSPDLTIHTSPWTVRISLSSRDRQPRQQRLLLQERNVDLHASQQTSTRQPLSAGGFQSSEKIQEEQGNGQRAVPVRGRTGAARRCAPLSRDSRHPLELRRREAERQTRSKNKPRDCDRSVCRRGNSSFDFNRQPAWRDPEPSMVRSRSGAWAALSRGLEDGKKTVVLNAPSLEVLDSLPRIGAYVIAGSSAGTPSEKPRPDLKKPWAAITRQAGVEGLRLHDLRHSFASVGAGGGVGLPIVGKLLGHSSPATTARYAHLDNDPLRRAAHAIGNTIAAAMRGDSGASIHHLKHS